VEIIKAHAYGNDFLFLTEAEAGGRSRADLARRLCARHTGVGADGLIVYRVSDTGAVMHLFNADGSYSEVSGNGVRCLAAIVASRRGLGGRTAEGAPPPIAIETDAGRKTLQLLGVQDGRFTFRAAMGQPEAIRTLDLVAAGEPVRVVALRVGNPQCVAVGAPVSEARMRRLGPALERHAAFPEGTNVEFAEVESPNRVRILIWERGVGPTEASGTGACAAAVAAAMSGGAARDVDVVSPGGSQHVEWLADGLFLTGWAEVVFQGRWVA
jgi:diaminopimelate epimerase